MFAMTAVLVRHRDMVAALIRDPLPPGKLALLSAGISVAVALYCLVYTELTGEPENVFQVLGWAIVNILPWIVALEGVKRARSTSGAALAVIGGLAASLALGFALSHGFDTALELWRRLPALAAVAVLTVGVRWSNSRDHDRHKGELPLLPRQIDWVQAAGNYVELRAGGRTIVHRASISATERDLAPHGFVRIHRSTLVRRDRITKVRPEDVILDDGTHLKIGKRYRAALQD
jgi:hypothetical protein